MVFKLPFFIFPGRFCRITKPVSAIVILHKMTGHDLLLYIVINKVSMSDIVILHKMFIDEFYGHDFIHGDKETILFLLVD